MRTLTTIILVVLTALLGACSSAPQFVEADPFAVQAAQLHSFAPQNFAGELESGSYIGIINLRGQVLAYVCDGTDGKASVSQWFRGTMTGGSLEASHPNGSTLSATLAKAGELRGSVQIAGAKRESFTAVEVSGPAGLWLGVGNLERAFEGIDPLETLHTVGWIVLPDGSQRGAANTPGGLQAASLLDPTSGQNANGSLAVNAKNTEAAGVRAAIYVKGRIVDDKCYSFVSFEYYARRTGGNSPNRYWGIIGWVTQCFNEYGSINFFLEDRENQH
jgi:hypothetical protein|uniref:Uncharacterized protein n=1 Tax=Meiothermus ruber TaxID=277 RepID=A0A7C3HDL0_MEIRU